MPRLKIFAATAAIVFVTLAASSSAKPALKDVPEVRDGLIAVGIAYEISEQCKDIRARWLRGVNYLERLKGRAKTMGYSQAEIDAYVDNRDEQRRLEGIARAQLADMGARANDSASYCSVGRAEMEEGSLVGYFLR